VIHVTPEIDALIDRALAEDLEAGDITTESLFPSHIHGMAIVMAKEDGILAGVEVARTVFSRVDASLDFRVLINDGSVLDSQSHIAEVEGTASSILNAERTAINFLQRLSGIATETNRYVCEVTGYDTHILDTRKTTPGLRMLEKYAVRVGGGKNHRCNLGDGVLIKDNHIKIMRHSGLDLRDMIEKIRESIPSTLQIEVEVEDLDQVIEVLNTDAELLLLDNMEIEQISQAVKMVGDKAIIEASGGINLQNVRAVAATGVDLISIGSLTHSVKAIDISLEFV